MQNDAAVNQQQEYKNINFFFHVYVRNSCQAEIDGTACTLAPFNPFVELVNKGWAIKKQDYAHSTGI